MERAAFDRMGELEDEHWWFVGRRAVLDHLIRTQVSLPTFGPDGARVLEAGCGTGGNLAMLSRFGSLDAFEYDAEARVAAKDKGIVDVSAGELPGLAGFPSGAYDLVALLDVLEHIDDDVASLERLGQLVRPSGRILLTVPAMPWLWSHHDELHHHKRRYTKRGLRSVVERAGMAVESIGYFNSLLFPAAVAQRMMHRVLGRDTPLDEMPAPWLNTVLRSTFAAERHLIGRVPAPAGLSIYAIVRNTR